MSAILVIEHKVLVSPDQRVYSFKLSSRKNARFSTPGCRNGYHGVAEYYPVRLGVGGGEVSAGGFLIFFNGNQKGGTLQSMSQVWLNKHFRNLS